MKRRFNVTGSCNPGRHYMVRLDDRVKMIKEDYVDYGSYFVINRGRQYGKTTTLNALEEYLKDDYLVLSLDFQLMGTEDFLDETAFSHSFADDLSMALKNSEVKDSENLISEFHIKESAASGYSLKELFTDISSMCKKAPARLC